jgi:hypothetical protein
VGGAVETKDKEGGAADKKGFKERGCRQSRIKREELQTCEDPKRGAADKLGSKGRSC